MKAKPPVKSQALHKENSVTSGNSRKATLTLPSKSPSEPIKENPAENVEAAPTGMSARELAAAEEKLAAQRAAQIKAMQAAAEQEVESTEDIASAASKGREHLMEQLRKHAEKQVKKQEEERPKPVISPAMQAKIDAEIARGREVQARHQAQWDARPAAKKEPWEGTTETVARPGNLVPDPKKTPTNTSVSGTFAAGDRIFSPNV